MATSRILVIDDELAVLRLVSKVLSRRGYEVQAVDHPLKALKVAEATPCFDLVLSDVIMPEMCGPELVKKLTRICPNAAVVLMSAHIICEDFPTHAKFISKPFLPEDLCALVEQTLPPTV
jgi:two-component system cell cycle sensor histidine kinase/response regulator CckA